MLKAIFAKHVKEGDVILMSGGKRLTVRYVGCHGAHQVDLLTKEQGSILLGEYDIVGLGHRPWPEGKTEDNMLNDVLVALIQTGTTTDREELKKRLAPLREAIEAYELGKCSMTAEAKGHVAGIK